MVVKPNKDQHEDIKKLNLNVKKLEEVTMDALSSFFSDKDNNSNSKKKPFLKEIFKVARLEERYLNGEIGTWASSFTPIRKTANLSRRCRLHNPCHARRQDARELPVRQ